MNPSEKILNRVSILDVIEAFDQFQTEKMGEIYFGSCPKGHASRGGLGFIIDPEKNIFLCFECGLGGNLVDLVIAVQELSYRDALLWIAERFCPDLLVNLQTASIDPLSPKPYAYYQNAFLYELLFKRGKKLLYDSTEGRNIASHFMSQQNYKQDMLRNTEWILFPKDGDIRSFLIKEFPEAQVWVYGTPKKKFEDKLPLQGMLGDKFRLAFPYRDRHGLITGFIKRSVLGSIRDKWDITRNIITDDPFYLYRASGEDAVIVLDRYSETMSLSALGFNDAFLVAVGPNGVEKSHVNAFLAFGIQHVTLLFTDQKNGEKATIQDRLEQSIRSLRASGVQPFIVEASYLSPYDTPERFVLGDRIKELVPKGISEFTKTVKNKSVSANIWEAEWMSKKWMAAPPGKRNEILCDIIDLRSDITDVLEQEAFDQAIKQHLELSDAAYRKAIDHCFREKELKQLHKEFRQILLQGLREEKSLSVMKKIHERIRECIRKFEKTETEGNRRLSTAIQEKFHIAMQPDTLAYRWQDIHLSLFPRMADITNGLQPGLYTFLHRPGEGTTSFILNLFLDALLSNCDISGCFIALDEPIYDVIDRFIACQTGIPLSQLYEEAVDDMMKLKEKAFQVLVGLTSQTRLVINDATEVPTFSKLKERIDITQTDTILTIIDGIHLLGRRIDDNTAETIPWMEIGTSLKSIALNRRKPILITYQIKNQTEGTDSEIAYISKETEDLFACSSFVAYFEMDTANATPSQMELDVRILKNKLSYINDTLHYKLLPQEGHRLVELDPEDQ